MGLGGHPSLCLTVVIATTTVLLLTIPTRAVPKPGPTQRAGKNLQNRSVKGRTSQTVHNVKTSIPHSQNVHIDTKTANKPVRLELNEVIHASTAGCDRCFASSAEYSGCVSVLTTCPVRSDSNIVPVTIRQAVIAQVARQSRGAPPHSNGLESERQGPPGHSGGRGPPGHSKGWGPPGHSNGWGPPGHSNGWGPPHQDSPPTVSEPQTPTKPETPTQFFPEVVTDPETPTQNVSEVVPESGPIPNEQPVSTPINYDEPFGDVFCKGFEYLYTRRGSASCDMTNSYEVIMFGSQLLFQELLDAEDPDAFSVDAEMIEPEYIAPPIPPMTEGLVFAASPFVGPSRRPSAVTLVVRSRKGGRDTSLNNAIRKFEASRYDSYNIFSSSGTTSRKNGNDFMVTFNFESRFKRESGLFD